MTKTPLHQVISDWVKEQINIGALQVDDKIPSENELAHQFEVSRLTVRRALQTLEQENLIFRSQGLGAFVKAPVKRKKLVHLTSFDEDLKHAGIQPESKTITKSIVNPPEHVQHILGTDEGKKVYQLDRVRFGDQKPFALDKTWLPVFYGQLVDDKDLTFDSLYQILESEYNITISKGCQRFDAAIADEELAHYLEVPIGSPLLLIRRNSYTIGNKIVYYQERYLRTDRFAYEMILERESAKNSGEYGMPITEFAPIFNAKVDELSI
ncbi:GntR family transcriptional regulator [bacterium]|nr:MAG: GntR family transcriptional regulator [bacterium]